MLVAQKRAAAAIRPHAAAARQRHAPRAPPEAIPRLQTERDRLDRRRTARAKIAVRLAAACERAVAHCADVARARGAIAAYALGEVERAAKQRYLSRRW